MPQNKDVKLVRSLSQKKFRTLHGLFIAEGKKIVEEAIRSGLKIHSVYTTDPGFADFYPDCETVTAKEMESMSELSTPSPYLAVIEQRKTTWTTPNENPVILLDGISDPGNLGTIIRTAEWFGIRSVICSENCVELYNPKVVQSTMGSIFRVSVMVTSLNKAIPEMKTAGYHVCGADLSGTSLFTFRKDQKKYALVIGSESHGISSEVKTLLDESVTIPGKGKAESLNASVAAGIMMAYMAQITE